MSKRIVAAALLACVVAAGCSGPFLGEGTTDRETTDATDSERVIAAPPSSETTGESGANGTATNGTTERTVETTQGTTETTQGTVETTRETNGTTTQATVATYNRDIGYEVRVSNAGGTPQNVTVRIAAVNDSAVAFAESVRLAPNESREFAFTFPHAGPYEATVALSDETVTRRWEVAVRDPDEALSVHVSPEGEVYVGFVAI